MDDDDNVQYGPASVAWAATAPNAPATGDLGLETGEIQAGIEGRRENAQDERD